jgi:putative ABC transport system permease protein
MIGLTLVVSMGVFASSFKASIGPVLASSTNADLYVTTASAQAEGYSPEATKAAASVPGVATVSAMGWGQARVDGAGASYSSVDPATVEKAFNLDVVSGSPSDLGADGIVVTPGAAKAHGWQVGDSVPVEFAATGAQDLQVRAIVESNRVLESEYLISLATQEANEGDRLDGTALVLLDRGADVDTVKDRIAAALSDHPDAKVLDDKGFEKEIGGFVDALLAFVSAMLLLAVVIALLGIVNTLALSVIERTRELGHQRAVGMTRNQVRSMVRWESVVISLIGAVLGAGLGIGLGMALAQSLKSDGVTELAIPVGQVAAYVVGAALAGVLAAVGPARSAAKVDVLKAVVTD